MSDTPKHGVHKRVSPCCEPEARRYLDALPATPAASETPNLDVERLARAFDLNGVNWPKRWGDNDFRWLARQVAAEYERLAEGAHKP